jgi:predicted nucleic acid-binding Zn ribbon protein
VPIYQYKCESIVSKPYIKDVASVNYECGHEYEVFYTSMSAAERDEPGEACPACGGVEKKRLISQGTSHILKGKGWYKDGY